MSLLPSISKLSIDGRSTTAMTSVSPSRRISMLSNRFCEYSARIASPDTIAVDGVADVDRQVVEYRALGYALQALDAHVLDDKFDAPTSVSGKTGITSPAVSVSFAAAAGFGPSVLIKPSILVIVVIKGEAHQQEQREYADLLAKHLGAFSQRAAFDHLDQSGTRSDRHRVPESAAG